MQLMESSMLIMSRNVNISKVIITVKFPKICINYLRNTMVHTGKTTPLKAEALHSET